MTQQDAATAGPPAAPTGDLDASLAARAMAGDAQAIEAIMRTYNQRLYRIARSVTRDDGEAEDVLQDAYVRAFTHLSGFRRESSLATWLTRIVLNEAFGRLRQARRRARLKTAVRGPGGDARIIPFPLAAVTESPERTIAQRQILDLVQRATDRLPDAFRTVFVARVVEGLGVEEIADLLGLRAATVRTRLHRAKRLIREAIEAEIGPVLTDAFPFAGTRCARLTDAVLARLGRRG